MDEMTDFRQEEQDAIKAQIPDDGLSGPLPGGVHPIPNDFDLRIIALEKALEANRGQTNADQIIKDARTFEAFLKGD